MCRRIAAAGEFMVLARWREDAGFRVFHFPTWAKARAMHHWIDRSGIAGRPMPRLGETPKEREERRCEALAWGLETGAVDAVVRAYRQARDRGESELTAFNAAADAALALGRPLDRVNDTARALIDWSENANHAPGPDHRWYEHGAVGRDARANGQGTGQAGRKARSDQVRLRAMPIDN